MQLDQKILSDITVFMKYARHREDLQRRETWKELVDRNKNMHIERYPHLKEKIEFHYKLVYDKKIVPSMRSLQFAGKPIKINESRIYNCAFLPIDDYRAFHEIMFLLLGGTGVGYSVQKHHVNKLPEIRRPIKQRKYVVGDSIEGWADAVKALMKAYFGINKSKPRFDFSDIRAKGERLITSGGKAPGPEPLKNCLHHIQTILDRKADGEKLTTLEAHDIICHIADAVLAGGIRRAALISLFTMDDESMLTSKFGNWWEANPQRGRANNSAVIMRHRVKAKDFFSLWERIKASGSGEPGIYFSNNMEWGANPCCEIALRPFQFCNLVDVNVSNIESQKDFNERVISASFIATLQASYTDFHYLREEWKETTEKEALIGVGLTGIATGSVLDMNIEEAAELVKVINAETAEELGINKAARATTVKPAGTTSLVLGCSSGIHAWHDPYYIRRIRVGKNESIYPYLARYHPHMVEDEIFRPTEQAVISVPQKAPEGAITRNESTFDLLERVKRINLEWVRSGHRSGDNTNNVSATISVKQDEWDSVGQWMWDNRNTFNGLSILPHDLGTYKQAPFETITKEEYETLYDNLKNINLTKVKEDIDNTELQGEIACGGGACLT